MDSLRSALTSLRDLLFWLPDPVVAALIIVLAVAIAYALHNWVRKLLRRMLAGRYPFLFSIFVQMRGVTRLALLILAVTVALPVLPISPEASRWIARLLLMSIIMLIGWAAVTGLHIAADIYLRRFRIDVEDNLLARKHFTQVRVLLRAGDALLILLTRTG